MKSFKDEVDKYLTIENVLWIFLILLPFLLKDSLIKESIQAHYFDYFKPIPFLVLIGVIFILWYIKSNLKTKKFIFKWFFPVCLWINLYMPKEGNGNFVIIFIDILFCVLILWTTFDILKPDSYNSELNQGLISDDPIESEEENDSFGRKDYAISIVAEIRKTVNKRAFNIAVTGAWGSGKTSFLNLIKGEMDKDVNDDKIEKHEKVKFITVKYNPWDFKEDKIIGLDLLKTISHELANEKDLQEKFKGLMVSLQGMNQSPWYKIIPYFLSGFHKEKSINEYRQEIGKILEQDKRKLVIFLDDLDRLDGDEILEVFKTIRNSFDIANTFFILGFDLEYVADQIESKVKGEKEKNRAMEYLEKIFQMQLNMPSKVEFDIVRYLENEIKFSLDPYLKVLLGKSFKLLTIRNIHSIINNLKTIDTSTNSNLDYDINAKILLQYIALKHPDVYQFMAYNYNDVFSNEVKNLLIPHGQKSYPIDLLKNIKTKVKINNFQEDKIELILESLYFMIPQNSPTISESEYYAYFKFRTPGHLISRTALYVAISEGDQGFIEKHINTEKETDLYGNLELSARDYKKLDKDQVDFIVRNLINYHAKLLNSEPTLSRLLKTNVFNFPNHTVLSNSDIYKEKSLTEYIATFDLNTQFRLRIKFWYIEDDSILKLESAFDNYLDENNSELGYIFELLYSSILPHESFSSEKLKEILEFRQNIENKFYANYKNNVINNIRPYVYSYSKEEGKYSYQESTPTPQEISNMLDLNDNKQKELFRWLTSGPFRDEQDNEQFYPLDYNLVFGEEYDSTIAVFSTM